MLREIREELRSRPARAPALTIQGNGGIGKTQVALEYTHRFKEDYDVVWWLNCGQPQYIDASLADLAAAAAEPVRVQPARGGRRCRGRQAASRLPQRAVSGAGCSSTTTPRKKIDTIQHLLPGGGGHVLVTSREPAAGGPGTRRWLTVFERGESISHLRRRDAGHPRDEAYQLAASLADVPLAVATAGALLASENMTVSEYLRLLRSQPPLPEGRGCSRYPER